MIYNVDREPTTTLRVFVISYAILIIIKIKVNDAEEHKKRTGIDKSPIKNNVYLASVKGGADDNLG